MLSNVYEFLLILSPSAKGKIFNGLNSLGPECGFLPGRRWWEGTEECSHRLEPSFGVKTRHLSQWEGVFWLLLASSFRDLLASSHSSLSLFGTLENLFLFACLWSMWWKVQWRNIRAKKEVPFWTHEAEWADSSNSRPCKPDRLQSLVSPFQCHMQRNWIS